MEIILKQDVENVGNKNDIVNVRPGFANNYLFPNGLATLATVSARKVLAENIKQQAHKEQKFIDDATVIANKLNAETLSFTVKAKGEKIYGSITVANVAEALNAKGYSIDRKSVSIEAIKSLGEFEAIVRLYKVVKATVKVVVVAEGEAKEAE